MACLHLIGSRAGLAACLTLAGEGDALVLLGDGTYAACGADITGPAPALRCYALDDDLVARGLAGRLPASITRLSHDGLVELVVEFPRSVSWY